MYNNIYNISTNFELSSINYENIKSKILWSDDFQRLAKKTQVWSFPTNDHVATRLTHSLQVYDVACKIVNRNMKYFYDIGYNISKDLIFCQSLLHDIGHTPFGHSGESAMKKIIKEKFGTNSKIYKYSGHNYWGLFFVLNILIQQTGSLYDTLFGIPIKEFIQIGNSTIFHNGESGSLFLNFNIAKESSEKIVEKSIINIIKFLYENEKIFSLEAAIVATADKISWLYRDINDAIKLGYSYNDFELTKNGFKIDDLIDEVIINNYSVSSIRNNMYQKTYKELYNKVYLQPKNYEENKIYDMMKKILLEIESSDIILNEILNNIEEKFKKISEFLSYVLEEDLIDIIKIYWIIGMTDDYLLNCSENLFDTIKKRGK